MPSESEILGRIYRLVMAYRVFGICRDMRLRRCDETVMANLLVQLMYGALSYRPVHLRYAPQTGALSAIFSRRDDHNLEVYVSARRSPSLATGVHTSHSVRILESAR
jgi:hypothetical protein